jgi:hypothetical protein
MPAWQGGGAVVTPEIWSWLLPTPLTVLLPGSAHVAAAHVTTAHVTAALPQLHPKSS